MKAPHREPLDELLRQWAGRQAPTAAEVDRLHRRVAQAVPGDVRLDLPPLRVMPARSRVWGWGLSFVLGVAVAIVVMVVLRGGGGPPSPVATLGGLAAEVPAGVFFAPSELAEKARLLAGMQDLFAGRLAWVGEAGREVQLGLLPDAVPGARGPAPLVVRVVVLVRKSGARNWEPIWQADVIAQDEEVVDLTADGARNGSLQVWMHTLPDGAIAVDANLALKDAACVRSLFSGIQRTGVPQRIFCSQTADAEYQVYQTVAPLQTKGSS